MVRTKRLQCSAAVLIRYAYAAERSTAAQVLLHMWAAVAAEQLAAQAISCGDSTVLLLHRKGSEGSPGNCRR